MTLVARRGYQLDPALTRRLGPVARDVLAEVAVCWEVAAYAGSLRVLAALASGVGEVVQQLKPRFRVPFVFVVATGSTSTALTDHYEDSAGGRWQPGTGVWE